MRALSHSTVFNPGGISKYLKLRDKHKCFCLVDKVKKYVMDGTKSSAINIVTHSSFSSLKLHVSYSSEGSFTLVR